MDFMTLTDKPATLHPHKHRFKHCALCTEIVRSQGIFLSLKPFTLAKVQKVDSTSILWLVEKEHPGVHEVTTSSYRTFFEYTLLPTFKFQPK